MATVEDLKVEVNVIIAKAVTKLQELQEELEDVAEKIQEVDARGSEGIDISTNVEDLDTELAAEKAKLEAFEQSSGVEIPMEVHDRSFEEILGRAGVGSVNELVTGNQDDFMAAVQGANLDFGGFNVPRGTGGAGGGQRDTRTSNRMRELAGRLREAVRGLDTFNIRMSDIHNLFASLVPLLFVFIGAVPAVVTAMYGLAAAAGAAAVSLGALAGLGALGVGLEGGQFEAENLAAVLEDIRSDFIEAFAPLAERLEPLFRDGLDGLETFFNVIADQGGALTALSDEARDFGQFLIQFIPGAIRGLAAMVEGLAPIFSNIGSFLDDNFNSFLRELTRLTAMAVPAVAALFHTIIDALPTLVRIGVQFAEVANILLQLIGVLYQVITLGGALDGIFGTLIASSLVAASAIALLSRSLVQLALVGLGSAIKGLFQFFRGLILTNNAIKFLWATNIGRAISSLISFVSATNVGSVSLLGFTFSARAAAAAVAAFYTVLTLGVAALALPLIADMATEFLGLETNIRGATDALKNFDRVGRRTSGSFNPYGGAGGGNAPTVGETGGGTTINIESSGDKAQDKSNARYATFREGRTTGGEN